MTQSNCFCVCFTARTGVTIIGTSTCIVCLIYAIAAYFVYEAIGLDALILIPIELMNTITAIFFFKLKKNDHLEAWRGGSQLKQESEAHQFFLSYLVCIVVVNSVCQLGYIIYKCHYRENQCADRIYMDMAWFCALFIKVYFCSVCRQYYNYLRFTAVESFASDYYQSEHSSLKYNSSKLYQGNDDPNQNALPYGSL